MSKKNNFVFGITCSLINVTSLGVLGVIDKLGATQAITSLVFSIQSVVFGFIFVLLFALVYRREKFVADLKSTPRRVWLYIILVGLFASGIFVLLRFIGLTQATGTFATISQIIITAVTALLALTFLKEKLSGKFWLLFAIIIISIYFVSVGAFTFKSIQAGDEYILLAAFFPAVANIFAKLATNKTHPLVLTTGRFFFGAIFLLLISLILNTSSDIPTIYIWSILSGLFWCINATAFNFAIQKIGVTLTTSILMLAPIITMILEFLVLNQVFTLIQVTAALVAIIAGILLIRTKV